MADTGFIFPGTMISNRTIAGSIEDWTSADNAKADDGNNVDLFLDTAAQISSGLAASNFDFSSIPAGQKIDGIEVQVGDYLVDSVAGSPQINHCRLILPGGGDGSEQKAIEITNPTTSLQTTEAGGATDQWGESLSVAGVQNSNFGFFIGGALLSSDDTNFDVDFMRVKIYYSPAVLPSTIISGVGLPGHHPPRKSSGGNFYVVALTTTSTIDVYKATNPAGNWFAQDVGGNPTGQTFEVISVHEDGDVLHIATAATIGGSLLLRYHTFNMATDQWVVVNDSIDGLDDDPTLPWISISVRSNGDVIVAYNGDTDQNMGGKKERVDYARREGGTWTAGIALDAGGDIHYGNPNVVKGPLTDDMHIMWLQTAATADPPSGYDTIQARTLDSGNSLSTTVADSGLPSAQELAFTILMSYEDAGTQRIVDLGAATSHNLLAILASEDGGDDIQLDSITDTSDTNEIFFGGTGGAEQYVSGALDSNNDIHVIYAGGGVNGVDQDVYYRTSTDDGATFSTAVEELDAVTVTFISANIYVRGSDTVLAYFYDDGGVQKYNEKVLSTAGGEISEIPRAVLTVAPQVPQVVTTEKHISELSSLAITLTPNVPDVEAFQSDISQLPSAVFTLSPKNPTINVADPQVSQLPSLVITVTPFVPTIEAFQSQISELPSQAITLVPNAPDVEAFISQISQLPSIAITVTTFIPSAVSTDNQISELPVQAITVTPFVPSVVSTDFNISTLPSQAITLTPNVPDAVITEKHISALGSATITLAPNVPQIVTSEGASNTSELPLQAITVTPFVPTVEAFQSQISELPSIAITVTPFVPTVEVSDPQVSQLPSQAITVTPFVPTVEAFQSDISQLPVRAIIVTPFVPTVEAFQSQISELPSQVITVTPFVPGVVSTDNQISELPSQAIVVTPFVPSVVSTEFNISSLPSQAIAVTPFVPAVVSTEFNISALPSIVITLSPRAPQIDDGEAAGNISQLVSVAIGVSPFVPSVVVCQIIAPDAILNQENLTGSVTDIDEAVSAPDANWLTSP